MPIKISEKRSKRVATIGRLPDNSSSGQVRISKTDHSINYVENPATIGTGPIVETETVDAWVLDNSILKVTAILRGGCISSIIKNRNEYIWLNKEGATYYGPNTNNFPLTRGLIVYGGIKLAVVAPEHGLYYDTDWDLEFKQTDTEASFIFTIIDTEENRRLLNDPFSAGQFANSSGKPMSRYPVTNAKYTFTVTLRAKEDFVRLNGAMQNPNPENIVSHMWIPQTYPITADSQILSHQKKRRCKDTWVIQGMLKDKFAVTDVLLDQEKDTPEFSHLYANRNGVIVGMPPTPLQYGNINLNKILEWPTPAGGILYDYPSRDGWYHGINFGNGRGAVYVTYPGEPNDPNKPHHFTKLWSWGDPKLYDRTKSANGRPKAEYYEPWGSPFNTAFFEDTSFAPGKHEWDSFIVLIESGLESNKSLPQLRETVDKAIEGKVKEELTKLYQKSMIRIQACDNK